jgi:hypothetical protein
MASNICDGRTEGEGEEQEEQNHVRVDVLRVFLDGCGVRAIRRRGVDPEARERRLGCSVVEQWLNANNTECFWE